MTLLGLSLAQLAGIFGVVGGAVTVLYILKLRRRRVHVPFARLWQRVLKEKESTSLFRRLKRLLSLLLQLGMLALLIGALGDPRLSQEVLEGRQIIVLIDASASMKADDGKHGTRMATALKEARKLVSGMGGADAMMLVRMDAQVTPLSAFTGDDKALLKVLADVEASDTAADLGRALKFCADALRDRKRPMLVLIGDGAYDEALLSSVALTRRPTPPTATATPAKRGKGKRQKKAPADLDRIDLTGVKVHFIPVGKVGHNIGIVAFSARRYPTNKLSFEVFLEVVHHAPRQAEEKAKQPPAKQPATKTANTDKTLAKQKPVEVDLQLLADGVLTEVQRLSLRPGERARFSCGPEERKSKRRWCEMAASGELLEARLAPAGSTGKRERARLDAFALDDRAYALLPKRRKQKILLVSTGDLFIEGAMLLDDNIEYSRLEPKAYTKAALRGFDAVVFDRFYPEQEPTIDTLVLAPPVTKETVGKDATKRGPFRIKGLLRAPVITDQNRDHPTMRWITLKDVNIAASAAFIKRPGDVVLAASFRTPVIIARQEDSGRKVVALGFDPRRSDLPLRVAFPILFINTFHWFSGETDELVTTYKTGETWHVPLKRLGRREFLAAGEVRVVDPAGHETTAPIHDGRAVMHGSQAGIYRVKLGQGGEVLRLAANLADSEESNISARTKLSLDGRTLGRPSGFGVALRREIWIYLLLIALGITLVEWLTYNRRITV